MAGEEQEEEELSGEENSALERSAFLTRAERVVDAVKGNVQSDFRKTPVTFLILRKIDEGNAKAIFYRASTVGRLYDVAFAWDRAQKNLPQWLVMPVPTKLKIVKDGRAPSVAPLELPRLTRSLFLRSGSERAKKEPLGISAQEAFSLFLEDDGARRVARSIILLELRRQGGLLSGAAEALRKNSVRSKLDNALKFDRAAALHSAAVLGVSLAKMGRHKEVYMNDAAFRLGQLLAVADVVHIGYCSDARSGDVPPTLLGNSVFATAQSDPVKALALLGRRWKPYAAWAKRPAARTKADELKKKEHDKASSARGWAISTAIWQARRAGELAQELHDQLPNRADDTFRAELLLGYVCGLPPKEKSEGAGEKNGENR